MITTDGNQLQTHACQCNKEETLSRLLKGMKSMVIYERVKKALNFKKKRTVDLKNAFLIFLDQIKVDNF